MVIRSRFSAFPRALAAAAAGCRWRARPRRETWPGAPWRARRSGSRPRPAISAAPRQPRLRYADRSACPTAVCLGDRVERHRIVDPVAGEQRPARRAKPARRAAGCRCRGIAEMGGNRAAVAALQFEQQPLEIARDLDVHARAEARQTAAIDMSPGLDNGRGCRWRWCRSPAARSAGRARARLPGIDVAEIAGRHAERHRPCRRAERQPGGEVVDDLRRDPREVDRVDRRQVQLAPQRGIGEQRLDDVLAIVEVPSIAIACAFAASTVVICRRCTSEMRPCGYRMKMSTRSRSRQASIAAEPVSPEVAPTIVTCSPRRASTESNSRPPAAMRGP